MTVEVGGSLELSFKDIVSAVISVSVSTTTESGGTQGAEKECPAGDYHCALVIRPSMVKVSGVKSSRYLKNDGTCGRKEKEYTVLFPAKGHDETSASSIDTCLCRNYQQKGTGERPDNICPGEYP